jgi:amino acid transporter
MMSPENEAIGDVEAPRIMPNQADAADHHSLQKIDQDSFMWHGREAAVKHARRYSSDPQSAGVDNGQGTIMGVVFPCSANILGVLLFLRLPWIVGKAGILQGFMLVLVCCSCTFITSLSLSAVATNGKILGGGSYYLISRSLGPAIGAGVGLCFYMANSIGAAMYLMGTVEAWEIALPRAQIVGAGQINNIRATASCLLVAALLFVAGGVKFVSRLGTVFLFIVFGVILCMYIGCLATTSAENFTENFGPAYMDEQKAFPQDTTEHDFISLMALWFPAVTGIMAGSNRSADLKDPAGSIPKGTLTAQLSTSVIYLSFVVVFGCAASRQELLDDPFFAATYAWPLKEVVMYGVMASTIGAGLTSLVSGSRLLSAIAADKTLPILGVFAAQPGKEPRLALLASGVLCACAIAIGQLNSVAPVLTMFFLMCYTCVNLSCAILRVVQDPNWRPSFRYYHWSISLLGASLCIWMMFAINWMYASVALVFCLSIFAYATHNSHEVKWGDGFQGVKFQLAKNILINIDSTTHTKNWRPQILVVTAANQEEHGKGGLCLEGPQILDFVSQLKGGRGITIVGAICNEDPRQAGPFVSKDVKQDKSAGARQALQGMLQTHHIKGFSHLVHTKIFDEAVTCLMQSAGLGAFQPNCVLAAWPEDRQDLELGAIKQERFIHITKKAVELQKVMLVAKGGSAFPDLQSSLTGSIDIWWIVADGGILLLLPFLLKKHRVWQHCTMRLFALAGPEDDPDRIQSELQRYVHDFRLTVEVHVKTIDNAILSAVSYVARSQSSAGLDTPPEVTSGSSGILKMISRNQQAFSPPRAVSHQTILGEREQIQLDPSLSVPVPVQEADTRNRIKASELELVKGLNSIIQSDSSSAELVVTNLPDMPPGEGTDGYFTLVEELTRGLQRCLLARGTTTEVITAFT